MTKAKKSSSASKVTKVKFGTAKAKSTASSASRPSFAAASSASRMGNDMMRNMFASGTGDAQKAQEKIFSFSRDTADNFARSTEAATRSVSDAVAMTRENIEACIECSNVAADMSKSLSAEVFNYANEMFSDNVEMSKEFFRCRTINDMFELQSRLARSNMDKLFSESTRFSEMLFRYASEAVEPINERVAEATERFSKTIAA